MSIKIMTAIWDRTDLDTHEKMVLLSLADHADDEGVCFPSIARLCDRTGMKERGVQNVLRRMKEAGIITVELNAGRRGANRYTIHAAHPRIECTPAPDAPPHPITPTPAPDAGEPPHGMHPNRHLTINNHHHGAGADEWDDLISGLCKAVGIAGKPPRSWSGPKARNHIAGWLDHLTPDQIIERATASRAKHPEAPATPQALDGFMLPTVPAKSAKRADRADVLKFHADWVNGDRPLPAATISPSMARDLVSAGLVTPQRLEERGIR
ncbi:helix-turn-helix domain-containing protein [Fuscibacter oryzae]|uniref:Helix-turn-helix domain-containing protein n=1 Tax=Fuscibacter oryzae TaxID=2803939 RepID=A0A8J7SWW3_9RHOB|nr:helix-turn-helix domain-containing protein [Fuscibacter oryzae]MBL4929349.1 helix-turn-helix domain-containing protein [Fuscibacter oryzae]